MRRLALSLAGLLVVLWTGFPLYWMAASALREPRALFRAPRLLPGPFSLDGFENLLALTNFAAYYRNSLVVALATTALTLAVAAPMAYVLARFRVRGMGTVVRAMLYAYMFPPLLLAIPLYTLFVRTGLADTLLSLVVAHTTITLPLGVWLLWGFFKTVPAELEEASMVDGTTRAAAFARVVLPLSVPGLITVGIFSFLLSWTDYTYALIMVSSDAKKTVPLGLAAMLGAFDLRWGEIMAGSLLIAAPLLAVFAALSRYFVRGLTAGAVKG